MGVRGNETVTPGQNVLKKKSGTMVVGWVLLIFGVIGVLLALIIYPTWQHNGEVLATKEAYRLDTAQDRATYNEQTVMVLGGLIVGLPMAFVGVYLVASAWSYNRKIDGALIQKAMQPPQMFQHARVSGGFCSGCEHQLSQSDQFCPGCGKKIE
jgi:hypothetical protein